MATAASLKGGTKLAAAPGGAGGAASDIEPSRNAFDFPGH
jgi:hypothetical protein